MVQHNLTSDVVTLGWGDSVVDVSDAAFSDKEILRRYIEQWHEDDKKAGWREWNKEKAFSNVWIFWNEIDVGDLVVLPPREERWVAIGRVAGRATLERELPRGARLWREVEWLHKEFLKSKVPRDLHNSIRSRGTVFEIRRENAHNRILCLAGFHAGGWSGDEAGVLSNDQLEVPEGAKTRVEVNRYERDPNARRRCLERYDYTCQVCGLKFEERYGDFARGFMHAHHKVPLSQVIDHENHQVNPVTDLVAVCPNCHAMLHRHPDRPCDVETLRLLMAEAQE